MSNEQNNSGISISISNEAVQQISATFDKWRSAQSADLKTGIEFAERGIDKCLNVFQAIEMARQASRRPDVVHVHEKTTKV